jgi:hypothetical protein
VLKAQLEIPDIPTEESGGINWDKHGLVARLATGAVFDLTQKEVRLEIARRMRFLKGSLTFVELNKEAKLGKNGGWIGAIEGGGSTLHREDIEKLATFSKMSVVELLLGTGIVPLIARESASSWLERYKESMPDGDELSDFAHRLKGELAKWPRPIQNMIVNFLKETLE